MTVNILDCSNSIERPAHRGGGGPIENDIIRYLWENAADYNCKFVAAPSQADVILTNDIFPSDLIGRGIPMVKRMCGPFWQRHLSSRNDVLNRAAQLADKVIFISQYSQRQYIHCFGDNLKIIVSLLIGLTLRFFTTPPVIKQIALHLYPLPQIGIEKKRD